MNKSLTLLTAGYLEFMKFHLFRIVLARIGFKRYYILYVMSNFLRFFLSDRVFLEIFQTKNQIKDFVGA